MTVQLWKFNPNERVIFNIVMVGDSGVGKTSLLQTYGTPAPKRFNCRATVGLEFKKITLDISGKEITLHMWDTPGQDMFNCLCPQYYRGAHGAILVYDVTKRKTFDNLSKWWDNIKSYANENSDVIIVGNKIDLEERTVTRKEGLHIAQMKNCQFMETSAYSGDGITHVLEKLVHKMLQHHVGYPKQPDTIQLCSNTYDVAVTKERSCCERMC